MAERWWGLREGTRSVNFSQQFTPEQEKENTLNSLLNKLDDLRTACVSLTATNDNRNAIKTLYDDIGDEIDGLTVVSESEGIGAAFASTHNQYVVLANALGRKLRYIVSEEEGTRKPQRRMAAAFADLHNAVSAFSERNDTRPAAVKAIGTIKANVAEVAEEDRKYDRWYIDAVYEGCATLLAIMEQPIKLAEETEAPGVMPNARRLKAKDAANELLSLARCIGFRYFAPLAETGPITVKIVAVRDKLSADIFSPLEDSALIAAELRAIKADISKLLTVYIPEDGTSSAKLLQGSVQATLGSADALLAIIDIHVPSLTISEPSFVARVLNKFSPGAFSWGEATESQVTR